MKGIVLIFIFSIICFIPHANAAKGRLVKGVWQQSWNDALKSSLKESGLLDHEEQAIREICPHYQSTDQNKMIFWQQLMVSLAWKESLHGPSNYIHFNGGINKGLYQINPVLRKAYGCSGYDLYDPIANIRCAVKMAKRLVTKYGSFLKGTKEGMAAYWQPLRATSRLNRQNRAKILADVKSACSAKTVAYISTATQLIFWDFTNPYDEVDLSFNVMEGDDINLEDVEDLEIETGVEEGLDDSVIINENDRIIEI